MTDWGWGHFRRRRSVKYIPQTPLSGYWFSLTANETEKLRCSIERYEQYTSGKSLRLGKF